MISYKDKTFCSFWEDCKVGQNYCRRALYPKVLESAKKWSEQFTGNQDEILVSMFVDKPECWEELT